MAQSFVTPLYTRVPQAVRQAVVGATFSATSGDKNEITTALDINLIAQCVEGMTFKYGDYDYLYAFGDSGTLKWIRRSISVPASGGGQALGTYDYNTVNTIPNQLYFTLVPGTIYFVPTNAQLRLDITTSDSRVNYYLGYPNRTGVAIVDFVNGVQLNGRTRFLLYPGDYLYFLRDTVNKTSCTLVQAGNVYSVLGLQTMDSSTFLTVAAGTFVKGELQGTQPAESVPGQKFCDDTYRYEFMPSSAAKDYEHCVWVRTAKA